MEGNKNKHIFSKYCMLSVAVMAAFLIFTFTAASPVKAITISQINVELIVNPGDTVDQLVQIYDETFSGATVYPVVYNFTQNPDREGGVRILSEPEDLTPDRLWLQWKTIEYYGDEKENFGYVIEDQDEDTADDDSTEAEAVETADGDVWEQAEVPINLPVDGTLMDFPYRIAIPRDAEPGTHLLSLVYQLKPASATGEEDTAVFIGSNVATNLFIKVLGNTIDEIEVDFQSGTFGNKDPLISAAERKETFTHKKFFLKPPVDFIVTIDNKGNTHQKPGGRILITNDLFGSSVPEQIKVNEENRIILPGTARSFEVSSFGTGFMFGKYRAKIEVLYGLPLQAIELEIDFWIVPLVEILIVLGSLILLITITIIVRKMRKKRRDRKEKEKDAKLREEIIAELKGKKKPPAEEDQPAEQEEKKGKKKKKKGNNKKNNKNKQ